MKLVVSLFYLTFICTFTHAQEWPVKKIITDAKRDSVHFESIKLFTPIGENYVPGLGTYQKLIIEPNFTSIIMKNKPNALRLAIQLNYNETLYCDLVKYDIGNVVFTQDNKTEVNHITIPVTYRGIVSGEQQKNNVMLTVNNNNISLTITFNDHVLQTSNENEGDISQYRLLDSRKINLPVAPFNCGTKESSSLNDFQYAQRSPELTKFMAPQDKCVYVFVDCFDSLYQWQNSDYQQTINYVYELFNAVATGYLNEQINIKVSRINIWVTADPYNQDNRDNALADLAAHYGNTYWGNICVGLDYSLTSSIGRSGIARGIGKVKGIVPNTCPNDTTALRSFCYNDLHYNVNVSNFPNGTNTTQQAIYLVMHEMGHLLGSPHTQWCGWLISTNPNTYGALDNCAPTEGGCAAGPAPGPSGGTIMSYCVGPGETVNFNNGFGTLPGNAIRNFVDSHGCINQCPTPCIYDSNISTFQTGFTKIEVAHNVTATGWVPGNSYIILDAGNKVTLTPGFQINNSSLLKIVIEGCGGLQ